MDAAQSSGNSKGSEWVRLQSSDGYSYLVKRKVAQASGTIRNMLDPESMLCILLPFDLQLTTYIGGYSEALSKICGINERWVLIFFNTSAVIHNLPLPISEELSWKNWSSI